jgi:asparagine synthase (glutamine-hydrolysing)
MSGVFGCVDTRADASDSACTVAAMARALAHLPWYVLETGQLETAAAGRQAIGIFNKTPQPLTSADGAVHLYFCGELYHANTVLDNPEQIALDAYLKHGPAFARNLNGQFTAAVIDAARGRLVLTNDRFGLYPHYYAAIDGGLVFGPELKCVLAHPAVRKTLDHTALAEYMRFQHLLGDRTFFEDVRLLPAASVLTANLRDGAFSLEAYWTFADLPAPRTGLSLEAAADEAGALLRNAVRRLTSDTHRHGVYLSGGLDSRTVLGMVERRPVVSLTYGDPACRDVRYAQRIAQVCGSEHHWCDLRDSSWVIDQAPLHLALTEGFHSWIHAHGMSTLVTARGLFDVNLSAWDGGTVMSHPLSWDGLQRPLADRAAELLNDFHFFNQIWTWPGLTEAEERLLYKPHWRDSLTGRAFDSFREVYARSDAYPAAVRRELFFIENHCRRLTQYFVLFTRSHVECRLPFFDYALFEYMFTLPFALRKQGRVWHALISRQTPQLARIPDAGDNRLPVPDGLRRNAHGMLMSLRARVNRSVAPVFNDDVKLYADYENWLRADLRSWAESILFDTRTLDRGIFDPDFLRTLMARHVSRSEPWIIGKIAPVMACEMMLRHLYD